MYKGRLKGRKNYNSLYLQITQQFVQNIASDRKPLQPLSNIMAQDPNTEAKCTVIINSEWAESESTVSFIIALKKTLLWGINFIKHV